MSASNVPSVGSGSGWQQRADVADNRQELRRGLMRQLRRNSRAQIENTFVRLLSHDSSRDGVAQLKRSFSQANRLDLLLDLFLSADPAVFGSLAVIAESLLLGIEFNRQSEVNSRILREQENHGVSFVHWSSVDYIKKLVPLSHALADTLRALKYPDRPNFRSASDLICYAELLASRMTIDRSFLQYLYTHSQFASLTFDAWKRRVQAAFCIDHITSDLRPVDGWHALIDSEAGGQALDNMDPSRGTLLMTVHAGFTQLAIAWVKNTVANSLIVTNEQKNDPVHATTTHRVYAGDDNRSALFVLYRALLDKRTVLIASDSRIGGLNSSINVLGFDRPLADGAAFLAFETGCNTAWYTIARDGNRLVPVVAMAPRREPKDTYAEYKDRLYRFYARQIENLLTGDPDNISAKRGWTSVLRSQA